MTEGEERRLRPLELRLLAYLAERPEVVVSPTDLLREVWGYADGVETRTVYATINRLRLALERDPKNPTHILNAPRLGYRFRPAVRPTDGPARGVRLPWNAFVGREAERTRLGELLAAGRLVTLRGASGVGKSRLAIELVRADLERGPAQPERGGVAWCDLTRARTEEDCVRALAEALGIGPTPHRPDGPVARSLRAREGALVVLDDADRALAALAARLPEWLGAPGPRFLVTSQTPLGVAGEVQYTLDPLATDTPDALTCEAGRLLEARVRERLPDFQLSREDRWAAPLLRALGGLPLALELAAPWLAVMSGQQLYEQVEHDLLSLREPGGSSSPGRSLADGLGWSWSLLDDVERATLTRCTAFHGAFDLRAAAGVVALADQGPPLHEVILRLVERSWLRIDARRSGQWFSFYRGQRAYVLRHAPAQAVHEGQLRHAAFHAGLGRTCDIETLFLVGGAEWQGLQARTADLRAAFEQSEGEATVAIALPLGRLLLAEGPLEECVAVVDRALQVARGATNRATLMRYRAIALRHLGRANEARQILEIAQHVAEEAGPSVHLGRVHMALGVLEMYHGDRTAGRRHLEAARAVQHRLGAKLDEAVVLAELGTLAFLGGDAADAVHLLERALAPLREAGASGVYGVYLVNLGVVELGAGRLDSAGRHLEEALEVHRRLGATRFEALALGNLALVEEGRGRRDLAHRHLDEAFERTRRTGDRAEEGALWSTRGLVHLGEGAIRAAAEALERAAGIAELLPEPRLAAEVLARRARVHAELGEWDEALGNFEKAAEIAERLGLGSERREAALGLGELWIRRGEPERARAALARIEGAPTREVEALRGRVEALERRAT